MLTQVAMVVGRAELRRRIVPSDRRIFLSYARLDNEVPALDREAKGWVRYLYDQLQLALRHRLGGEIEFWRDCKDIDENELFEELIEEGLEGSAHLLAVVSPGYLKSNWCKREWQRFLEKGGGETRGTIERVIKVLKHHMDEACLPPVFQKRKGYEFFALDPDSKREGSNLTVVGFRRRTTTDDAEPPWLIAFSAPPASTTSGVAFGPCSAAERDRSLWAVRR